MLGAAASQSAAASPEILPIPTAKEPLTFTAESKHVVLVTSSVGTVECTAATSKGLFTSSDAGTVIVTFTGCKGKTPFSPKVLEKCNTEGSPGGTMALSFNLWLVTFLLTVGKEPLLSLGTLMQLPATIIIHCELFNWEFSGSVMGQVNGITKGSKTKSAEFNFRVNKEAKQELKECDLLEVVCLEGKAHKKFELHARFIEGEEFHELATEFVEDKVTLTKEVEVLF
jgi:hypothetical protein